MQKQRKRYICLKKPEIFNKDQGIQLKSEKFRTILELLSIRINMYNLCRTLDNLFVEMLWRTVKYEYVFLHNQKDE